MAAALLVFALGACGRPEIVTELQTIDLRPPADLLACPAPLPRLSRNPPPTNAQMAAWAETAYQGHLACHQRVQSLAALYFPDR